MSDQDKATMFKELVNLVDKIVRPSLGELADELDDKEKVCLTVATLLHAYCETGCEIDTFLAVYNEFVSEKFQLGLVQGKDEEIEALRCKLDTYERALKALGSRVN